MDPVTTEPFPSDNELAKRLFSSPSTGEPRHRHASYSPHESPNKRDPLHKEEGGWAHRPQDSAVAASRVTRSKPRVGFCGALIFLALCLAALTLTVRFNSWGLHAVTSEDVSRFFSNQPLHNADSRLGIFYFNGSHFLGLGALQLSVALGVCCAVFTCVFTFYDSNVPGNFPPTPVSPRRQEGLAASQFSSWHLGYIFVPVNCLVTFSLALFYFRWNLGLPLV